MILWVILFILTLGIGYICFKLYGNYIRSYVTECIIYFFISLFCTGVIAFAISACAPNQFKPNKDIMFSQTVCENIAITPSVQYKQTYTDYYNIEYQVAGTKITLSEEVQIYCTEFEVSTIGYPYIEKYFCDYFSPIRNFLYGSWSRPRWYYKIYLIPNE